MVLHALLLPQLTTHDRALPQLMVVHALAPLQVTVQS
jgi:hypothetical protein